MKLWYQPSWRNREIIPTKTVDLGEIRRLLTMAVVRRLMSDVPWGVLLSGGLDSSLIASIASRHVRFAPPPHLFEFAHQSYARVWDEHTVRIKTTTARHPFRVHLFTSLK